MEAAMLSRAACCSVRTGRLWFGSAIDKAGDIGFQLGQIFVADVHHVPGLVILQVNVLAKILRQPQVVHGVFGGQKWRGQVIDPVFHFYLEVRIRNHGAHQVALDIRRAGEAKVLATLMLPVPLAARAIGGHAVSLRLFSLRSEQRPSRNFGEFQRLFRVT